MAGRREGNASSDVFHLDLAGPPEEGESHVVTGLAAYQPNLSYLATRPMWPTCPIRPICPLVFGLRRIDLVHPLEDAALEVEHPLETD